MAKRDHRCGHRLDPPVDERVDASTRCPALVAQIVWLGFGRGVTVVVITPLREQGKPTRESTGAKERSQRQSLSRQQHEPGGIHEHHA